MNRSLATLVLLAIGAPASAQCPWPPDHLEPNDSCAGAVTIGAGRHRDLNAGHRSPNFPNPDPDYYRIVVPPGLHLGVWIRSEFRGTRLDAALFADACGSSNTESAYVELDDRSLHWTNDSAGPREVVLRVEANPYVIDGCHPYELEITVGADPCTTPDDPFGDDDSCVNAVPLPLGLTTGLLVRPGDDDHYRVLVPANEVLWATFLDRAPDHRVRLLLDDDACLPLGSAALQDTGTRVDGRATLIHRNDTSSTVAVRLKVDTLSQSTSCSNYDLDLRTTPDPALVPWNDAFEPNDRTDQAVRLSDGVYDVLNAGKDDPDVFEFIVDGGRPVFLSVLPLGDLMRVGIEGPIEGSRLSTGSFRTLSTPMNRSVHAPGPGRWIYRMTIDVPPESARTRVPYMFRIGNAVERDVGVRTCSPAVTNSSGRPASLEVWGRNFVSFRDMNVVARELPRNSFGFFLTSRTPASVPMAGGSQGTLCLGGSVGRFAGQVLSSGFAGNFALRFDPHALPSPTGSVAGQPGETWHFQAWFRDANPGTTSNFTDAVAVTLN